MAVIYTEHFVQFFDDNGDPLSNGKLYAYSAGTTTLKATYTTQAAAVQNTNPVILDSAGRATLFIEGAYRFDLFDENDALIKSTDNVSSFQTLSATGDPFFQSFSGTGAQTVFTLSESLGDDSKDIMVFLDAGGTEGYEIQDPSAYTLSATSLTFNSAPASGTDNIYVFAPTKLLGAASASAAAAAASEAAAAASETAAATSETNAATSETNAATSETNAAASEAAAALSAATLQGTSTTSLLIEVASKVFTTQSGKQFDAGAWLLVTSDADPTNYMHGQVTSYSGTTLTLNVTNIGGSGTFADWTIDVSGTRGAIGATGPQGPAGAGLAAVVDDTTPQLGGVLDTNSFAINESEGAAVASATTADIFGGGDGNTVHITGTTTITDFTDAPRVGAWRKVIFDGVLTLTHGSGITLPGSANITTAAGDIAFVYADTVSAFRVAYFRADGTALVGGGGAWSIISNFTGTGDASADITGFDSATYDGYVIVGKISPDTDNQEIRGRTSTDGGSTWDNGTADYNWHITYGQGTSTTTSGSINNGSYTYFGVPIGLGGASGEVSSIKLELEQPDDAEYNAIDFSLNGIQSAGETLYARGTVARIANADINGVQLFSQSGNVSYDLYFVGRKKS